VGKRVEGFGGGSCWWERVVRKDIVRTMVVDMVGCLKGVVVIAASGMVR